MPTTRLYWEDSLRFSFEGEVLTHVPHEGPAGAGTGLVLAATYFYPEAGGQLADRGKVSWEGGTAPLVDAQEDAQGQVLHLVEPGAALPPPGTTVRIEIDPARRRDHMSQHSGQHVLSRALLDRAGGETISSRLGETICTIDTPLARLPDSALSDAEALACELALEDRPITALRPEPGELAKLKLRRDPKVTSDVRIIDIDGFDLSPCGGTHCTRTGQIGPVKIVSVERYKGGHRISFHAGARAVRDSAEKERILAGVARELTCAPKDVPGAVEKLRASLKTEVAAGAALRERLSGLVAAELLAAAKPEGAAQVRWVIATLPGEGLEQLRALAARIAEAPDAACVLLAPGPDGVKVVVARGSKTQVDSGATLKRIAAAAGGRGGGRPDRAEGQLPPGADLDRARAAAREEG